MILEFTNMYALLGLVDVQFRLKEFDSQEKWEEIKVSFTLPVHSPSDAERIARELLRNMKSNGLQVLQEVRWNVAGNPKGQVIKNTQTRYIKKTPKRFSYRSL